MARIHQLQNENQAIKRRYDRAYKNGNITEMYAARKDYQERIDEQQTELQNMDKSSEEYQQAKRSIDEQQSQVYGMRHQSKTGNEMNEIQSHMKQLEKENEGLSRQMNEAASKGNTGKYEELSHKYSTNLRAQEGISSELKSNGIEHESTVQEQKTAKLNNNITMRNSVNEKIDKDVSKGKTPDSRDVESREKYTQMVKDDERQALESIDKRKLEEMESYGVSREAIEKERQELERERDRILGEKKKQ